MSQTVLITGCSSGIGRATALHFQKEGWNVAATVRSPEKESELSALENVLVTKLDATDHSTVKSAVSATLDKFGGIDVVVNNAGYGAYGLLEATPIEKIRRQFEVNVIGVLAVTQAVLPHFRSRGAGTFVNISSMGGKITFPLGTLYHGSKFAVEGMSEALSHELTSIGVRIKLIEPGIVRTNFGSTSLDLSLDPSLSEYAPFVEKIMAAMERMGNMGTDASAIAEAIFGAATDGTDQIRYPVGDDAVQILEARKSLEDKEYMAAILAQFGL